MTEEKTDDDVLTKDEPVPASSLGVSAAIEGTDGSPSGEMKDSDIAGVASKNEIGVDAEIMEVHEAVQEAAAEIVAEGNEESDGLWPEYCNPSYRMPSEIEVKVKLSSGDYYFPVTVEKAMSQKLYLGGYRNKQTGQIYHHCSTQTPTVVKKEVKDVSKLRCRETQTYVERTVSVQPYRESGTQMAREDLLVDDKNDYEIEAKNYFTSDQLLELKKRNSVFIQRVWRGYMARCRAHAKRKSNADFEAQQKEDALRAIEEAKKKQEADIFRRANPKTNEDFSILYNELDEWRRTEMQKIKTRTSPGEKRNEAMNALLMDETKALTSIQHLKVKARKGAHVEKTDTMLSNMAKPRKWQLSNGEEAQVITPATQRAKELLDLYKALQNGVDGGAIDERLDILLHVKWTVLEFDSALSKDIADLTDREADLLNRGRPIKSMERLRKRLGNLFLEFIENPKYNPRAADFVGKSG